MAADIASQLYACTIRGRTGGDGLLEGRASLPDADCMQRKFELTHTTAGAIAGTAILVCREAVLLIILIAS